jgi:hypothetical protein
MPVDQKTETGLVTSSHLLPCSYLAQMDKVLYHSTGGHEVAYPGQLLRVVYP